MFFASISTVDRFELFSSLYFNVLFVIEEKAQFVDYFILQCATIDTGSEIPKQTLPATTLIIDFVISDENILNIIRGCSPNKARSFDGISVKMIELSDAPLVAPLKIIFT